MHGIALWQTFQDAIFTFSVQSIFSQCSLFWCRMNYISLHIEIYAVHCFYVIMKMKYPVWRLLIAFKTPLVRRMYCSAEHFFHWLFKCTPKASFAPYFAIFYVLSSQFCIHIVLASIHQVHHEPIWKLFRLMPFQHAFQPADISFRWKTLKLECAVNFQTFF